MSAAVAWFWMYTGAGNFVPAKEPTAPEPGITLAGPGMAISASKVAINSYMRMISNLVLPLSLSVEGATMLMSRLKRSKPWLFGTGNSSSSAAPPPSAPPQKKSALEMTEEEWRRARADILRKK